MTDTFTVVDKVYAIVADVLECKSSDLQRQTEFIADLGADQLDMLEIAQLVEQTFKITIAAYDLERLTTVGLLFDYVYYFTNVDGRTFDYD